MLVGPDPMRILILHNHYQQPGGEDRVVEAEADWLASAGHEVTLFVRHNSELAMGSGLSNFANALWNRSISKDLRHVIRETAPDVAHVHNVFSVLSPAVYHVLRQAGIPVVQTLHNFRLACPSARLLRNGRACVLCRGQRVAWPAVRYRCYQSRLSSSVALVAVLALHRFLRTWVRGIDLYLAPSNYVRNQLIPAGLPPERVVVKPHGVVDPGPSSGPGEGYALFIGRLEAEKGIRELLAAWRLLPGYPLRVVGDGPLEAEVQSNLSDPAMRHVSFLGRLPREATDLHLKKAAFLVIPSLGPESFGLTAVEAFSHGIPALAAGAGALPEIVRDGVNGLVADPCDTARFAVQAKRLFDEPILRDRLGCQARADYLGTYTPDRCGKALLAAYMLAIRSKDRKGLVA